MFWFALIGVLLLCILFTAFEKWTWVTLSLMVTGGVYFWINKAVAFSWLAENWQTALIFAGAYLVIGVIWSFPKWFFFLIGFRDGHRERKAWFLRKFNLDPEGQVPANLLPQFTAFLKSGSLASSDGVSTERYPSWYSGRDYYGCSWDHRPRASEHKSRITGWIGFWPFSMIGTVINDPIRKLVDYIFAWFKGLYQKMSDYIFRKEDGLN